MSGNIRTARLTLAPVSARDVDTVVALPGLANIARALIEDSLDASSATCAWMIVAANGERVGLIGVRPPSVASLRLRAIGWRSLEVVMSLEPTCWGHGYAREAIEAVAEHLRADPVIFALVGGVEEANARAHTVLQRSGFQVLGHAQDVSGAITVYELAL